MGTLNTTLIESDKVPLNFTSNFGSDHQLLLRKIRINAQIKRTLQTVIVKKLNIELRDQTVKALYENWLRQKLRQNSVKDEDDVETGWMKLEQHMMEAAIEALGERNVNKKRGLPEKILDLV